MKIPAFASLLPTLILLLLGSLAATPLCAQEVQTNAKGERIIVFPDGSWRHFTAADTVYLYKSETEFLDKNEDKADPFEMPKGEKQGSPPKKTAAKSKTQSSWAQGDNPEKVYVKARQDRIELENKIAKLEKNPKKQYSEELSLAREALKDAQGYEKATREAYELYKKNPDAARTAPAPVKATKSEPKPRHGLEDEETQAAPPKKAEQQAATVKSPSRKEAPAAAGLSILPVTNTLNQSRPLPCQRMPTTSSDLRSTVKLKPEVFFSYSDETLKPFLGERDFIVCESSCAIQGKSNFLVLDFAVYSKNARQEYGHLQEGSMLLLSLIGGQHVTLFNGPPSSGLYDEKNSVTRYQGVYEIGKEEMKSLEKSEIDAIRVVWSTGYEDYEIYNIDLLRRQLACLRQL